MSTEHVAVALVTYAKNKCPQLLHKSKFFIHSIGRCGSKQLCVQLRCTHKELPGLYQFFTSTNTKLYCKSEQERMYINGIVSGKPYNSGDFSRCTSISSAISIEGLHPRNNGNLRVANIIISVSEKERLEEWCSDQYSFKAIELGNKKYYLTRLKARRGEGYANIWQITFNIEPSFSKKCVKSIKGIWKNYIKHWAKKIFYKLLSISVKYII